MNLLIRSHRSLSEKRKILICTWVAYALASSVRHVISGRLDLARSRGCDAVEPDNVDGYSNNNGLGLSKSDQLDFNRWLARGDPSLYVYACPSVCQLVLSLIVCYSVSLSPFSCLFICLPDSVLLPVCLSVSTCITVLSFFSAHNRCWTFNHRALFSFIDFLLLLLLLFGSVSVCLSLSLSL